MGRKKYWLISAAVLIIIVAGLCTAWMVKRNEFDRQVLAAMQAQERMAEHYSQIVPEIKEFRELFPNHRNMFSVESVEPTNNVVWKFTAGYCGRYIIELSIDVR